MKSLRTKKEIPQPGTNRAKGISSRAHVGGGALRSGNGPAEPSSEYFSWSKLWQGFDCRGGSSVVCGGNADTDVH